MISFQAQENGGEIEPHWFAEKNYVEVRTPEGLVARVGKGNRQNDGKDACVALALNALEPKATAKWYAALGLRAKDGFLDGALSAINPLSDGAIRVDSPRAPRRARAAAAARAASSSRSSRRRAAA